MAGTAEDCTMVHADRLSTANRFEVLQGEKNRVRDDHDVIYVMMGVSIVRKIDRTVCRGRTVKTTTTVCLPGARVDDVRKWVGQVEGPGVGGGRGGGRFVGTTKAC